MAIERHQPPEVETAAHSQVIEVASANGIAARKIFGLVGAAALIFGLTLLANILVTALGAITFLIYTVGVWAWRKESAHWHHLEYYFDEWPLALGSTSRVTVARASKKVLPDAAEYELSANLKCIETVEWQIPPNAPISYDGKLLRVMYTLSIRTDTQFGRDPQIDVPVVVVPKNGLGRYRQPHPLPA